jgi:hypothetical protein
MDELQLLEEAIVSRLIGDTTLMNLVTGVYLRPAPQEATGVIVEFAIASEGEDNNALSTERAILNPSYLVFVRGRDTGTTALKPASNRVDALLHGWSNTTNASGGIYLIGQRESGFRNSEPGDGVHYYQQVGGYYRFYVSPT